MTELRHFHSARKGSGSLRPFPIYPLYTQTVILSLDKPIADCLKERPDVLEVLKKSDRKMKYMEVDLKSEQRRKNAENGAESYVPSKEDSLERLVYSAKCQFADDAEGVEDAVIKKDDLCRLRAALDQLSEEERALIHALFFDERSERELEEMMGVHRMTLHNRKIRILQKLKKMLR